VELKHAKPVIQERSIARRVVAVALRVVLVSMPTSPFTSARFARSESTVSVVSTNVNSANLAHLIARKEAVAAPLVCQVLFLPRELASLARLVRAHPSEVRVA